MTELTPAEKPLNPAEGPSAEGIRALLEGRVHIVGVPESEQIYEGPWDRGMGQNVRHSLRVPGEGGPEEVASWTVSQDTIFRGALNTAAVWWLRRHAKNYTTEEVPLLRLGRSKPRF